MENYANGKFNFSIFDHVLRDKDEDFNAHPPRHTGEPKFSSLNGGLSHTTLELQVTPP